MLIQSYAAVYDIDAVILRFFNVYGPHQDYRRTSPPLTSYLVRELLNQRTPILHSDGEQSRDYVFVEDLLRLCMLCIHSPKAKGEVFNVASGAPISVNGIYKIIAKAMDDSAIKPIYHNASSFWKRYPLLFKGQKPIKSSILEHEVNKRTVGSYAKAEKLLGWKPQVTMEEGLNQMVKFVKSHQGREQRTSFSGGW